MLISRFAGQFHVFLEAAQHVFPVFIGHKNVRVVHTAGELIIFLAIVFVLLIIRITDEFVQAENDGSEVTVIVVVDNVR